MDERTALLSEARECLLVADLGRAETLLRQVIAQDPNQGAAYELLGKLLYRDSRRVEAAAVYREWLHAIPADPVAAHLVAATSGVNQPERASDGFIESLFGRAAPEFDATLAKLRYRAPQLVFERAMAVMDPACVGLELLDLGCGTGLCAEWFRPLARRVVGVDLAPGMLERARARGCYDELICEEITAYAAGCTESFDVVTAADVFCYFGDLEAVFTAVAALVRPGGLFVFSVEERAADPTEGQDTPGLLEHGRYAHSKSYLERVLPRVGLSPATIARGVLRFERGAPVGGLVTVAQRA
jgi:predicted TPR repeat methyltransferase